MARLPPSPFAPASPGLKKDPLLDLNRLLSRLEQSILHANADQERRLRRDEFERTKVRYDIVAARAVLTRLEQDATYEKLHSRRPDVSASLTSQRERIATLLERVQDLEDAGPGDEDEDSSDGEDVLADIIPTPSESMDSSSTDVAAQDATPEEEQDEMEGMRRASAARPQMAEQKAAKPKAALRDPSKADGPAPDAPSTHTSHTMRARGPRPAEPAPPPAPATDTAQTTSASLFEKGSGAGASVATEEAMLDNHRKEQEAISEDILRLAKALKTKSLTTSRLLEEDKDVLGRVGDGLNTADDGMGAAGRRMRDLARTTEEFGWWKRMMYFAGVYGMMVLLVVIFLTLPKLRF